MEQRDEQIIPRTALTQERLSRGWSRAELAQHVGTTFVDISRWERGLTRPGPTFRTKLCTLFNKSESELGLIL